LELKRELEKYQRLYQTKIATLEKRKSSLLKQIENIDSKIQSLQGELDTLQVPLFSRRGKKPRAGRIAKGGVVKKRRGPKGKRLIKPGILKKTMIEILKASRKPLGPKELTDAILKNNIYKKPPERLYTMIGNKLCGPEFKRVGKGKYRVK